MIDESTFTGTTKWFLKSSPRGRNFQITNVCNVPSRKLSVDTNGDCYLCSCEAWLPISVGKITDFNRLDDIWSNDLARDIQQDIHEKKYSYCSVTHCDILNNNVIHRGGHEVSINIDESCNLACPSCRTSLVNHTSGPLFESRLNQINHFIKLINDFDKPISIILTGNGDPLASLSIRPLLLNWEPKSNQVLKLKTNGLLMKKLLPDSTAFPNIVSYQISVDAGSQGVYENVRRPGKFNILQENLQWLSDNKKNSVDVLLHFCLQAANVNDVVNFADMCNKFKFKGHISKLDDWRTFSDHLAQDVSDPRNPLHNQALEQLTTVKDMPGISLQSFLKNLL
jgi:hypothetical protein